MSRHRVFLTCAGLTEDEGRESPALILQEFTHRPWNENVRCRWDGTLVWLEAENDYDTIGAALLDEFQDAVVACVAIKGPILRFGPSSIFRSRRKMRS